jgi:hypothetical protein
MRLVVLRPIPNNHTLPVIPAMRKKIPDTIPAAATAAQATLLSSPGGNALNKAKPAPKPESNIA